jgi:hypothetical protein
VAAAGATAGLCIPAASAVGTTAIGVRGVFPAASDNSTISGGRGRGATGTDDRDTLGVAIAVRSDTVPGTYLPGRSSSGGRAPSGGWPSNWTLLTNDSNNRGSDFEDIDIFKIFMMDNSSYMYFKMNLQNLTNLYVNDEWNFYFKTNDSSTNKYDQWYRVSLRVTNTSVPQFNSSLSNYQGSNNPPGRSDFTSVNETKANGGASYDGTLYGYYFDKTNNTILFWVSKSIGGNLLGPGNTTRVYADTWWVDSQNRWRNYDRAPNGNNVSTYTMVPEFQDILVPVAGSVLVFVVLRGRARRVRPARAGTRDARRQKR